MLKWKKYDKTKEYSTITDLGVRTYSSFGTFCMHKGLQRYWCNVYRKKSYALDATDASMEHHCLRKSRKVREKQHRTAAVLIEKRTLLFFLLCQFSRHDLRVINGSSINLKMVRADFTIQVVVFYKYKTTPTTCNIIIIIVTVITKAVS